MTRRQIIILVALAVFIGAGAITGLVLTPDEREHIFLPGTGPGLSEEIPGFTSTSTDFTPEVPESAVETVPQEEVELLGSEDTGNRLGVYRITASVNGYEPDQIVVRQNDVVLLELTAEGRTLDVFSPAFGFYLVAEDGATEQLSFRAPVSGTFRLTCRDYCPATGPIEGTLVVQPKEQ